jgi:uncharacterized membrane protein
MSNKLEPIYRWVQTMWKVLPLALFATSVVFDVIGLVTENGAWPTMSFYLLAAGIIGGVFAALFGLFDYLAVDPAVRTRGIGLLHGAANLLIVFLFAASWDLRLDVPSQPTAAALLLSWLGIMLSLFSGWLGVEWVEDTEISFDADSL